MKIEHRILPREEYGRLEGTETAAIVPHLRADGCVLVLEVDGQIVAAQAFQPILHAEGLWIHPEYRKQLPVARTLLLQIRNVVRDRFGLGWFFTAANSDDVREMLRKLGAQKLPDHYVVAV